VHQYNNTPCEHGTETTEGTYFIVYPQLYHTGCHWIQTQSTVAEYQDLSQLDSDKV